MNLYEAVETICKDYCKYPDIESGNRLADICDKCPMNECEELRWADRKTEPMKTTDYCDICKRDMCEDCIADATNPYCVPSHYEINYELKDEPKTQMKTQNSNLTFEKDECAKEYEELGLKELKELINADRKTEPQKCDDCVWSVCNYNKVDWEQAEQTEPNCSEKPNNLSEIPTGSERSSE